MSKLRGPKRRNFTRLQAEEVYEKQNGLCDKCQKPFQLYQLHKHHQDGDESNNKTENLRLLCSPCHHSEPFQPDDKRRNNTHKVTFYLRDETCQRLQNYINANYSTPNAYGAISRTMTAAISYYCSNMTNKPIEEEKKE